MNDELIAKIAMNLANAGTPNNVWGALSNMANAGLGAVASDKIEMAKEKNLAEALAKSSLPPEYAALAQEIGISDAVKLFQADRGYGLQKQRVDLQAEDTRFDNNLSQNQFALNYENALHNRDLADRKLSLDSTRTAAQYGQGGTQDRELAIKEYQVKNPPSADNKPVLYQGPDGKSYYGTVQGGKFYSVPDSDGYPVQAPPKDINPLMALLAGQNGVNPSAANASNPPSAGAPSAFPPALPPAGADAAPQQFQPRSNAAEISAQLAAASAAPQPAGLPAGRAPTARPVTPVPSGARPEAPGGRPSVDVDAANSVLGGGGPGKMSPAEKAMFNLAMAAQQRQESQHNPDPKQTGDSTATGINQFVDGTMMDPGYGVPNVFDFADRAGVPYSSRTESEGDRLLKQYPVEISNKMRDGYMQALIKEMGGSLYDGMRAYHDGPDNYNKFVRTGVNPLNDKREKHSRNYIPAIEKTPELKDVGLQIPRSPGIMMPPTRRGPEVAQLAAQLASAGAPTTVQPPAPAEPTAQAPAARPLGSPENPFPAADLQKIVSGAGKAMVLGKKVTVRMGNGKVITGKVTTDDKGRIGLEVEQDG